MSKKKDGLENALQALKIGNAFQVPKGTIEFKEPKIEAPLSRPRYPTTVSFHISDDT